MTTSIVTAEFRIWYISDGADPNGSRWYETVRAGDLTQLQQQIESHRPNGHWPYAIHSASGALVWLKSWEGWDTSAVNAAISGAN